MKKKKGEKLFLLPFWIYLVFYLCFTAFLFFHQLKIPQSYKDTIIFNSFWQHSGQGHVIGKETISTKNADGGKNSRVTRYRIDFKWSSRDSHESHTGQCYDDKDVYHVGDAVSISIFNNNHSVSKIHGTLSTPISPLSIYTWIVKLSVMATVFPLLIYIARLDKRRIRAKDRNNPTTAPKA